MIARLRSADLLLLKGEQADGAQLPLFVARVGAAAVLCRGFEFRNWGRLGGVVIGRVRFPLAAAFEAAIFRSIGAALADCAGSATFPPQDDAAAAGTARCIVAVDSLREKNNYDVMQVFGRLKL